MTSKQALELLIKELKRCHSDGETLTYYDRRMIDILKAELNILQIIRKYFKIEIDLPKSIGTYITYKDNTALLIKDSSCIYGDDKPVVAHINKEEAEIIDIWLKTNKWEKIIDD